MKEEEKELLLKDLCARLPYIPIIKIEEHDWNTLHIDAYDTPFKSYYLEPFIIGEIEIKPYLRPMSSMTDEEKEELRQEQIKDERLFIDVVINHPEMRGKVIPHFAADWCNKNHFDYRNLIPKGLALEAPEGMYKLKK